MNYLSGLDADQRRAVLYTSHRSIKRRNRPLIVHAGPGAGKTHLLASCVGHAISTGVSPSKILLLAFGRKARRELRQRLTGLRSHEINCDDVTCTTFHSLALTTVREFHKDCGLGSNFTVVSGDAVYNLLSLARLKLSSKDRERLPPVSELKRVFSYRANSCRKLATVLKRIAPRYEPASGPVRAVYRQYQRLKRQNDVVDFDDLLRLCLKLLRQRNVGDKLRHRYARIYVDEYQDTSRIQALILQRLRPSGEGVTIVGDSRQAIFSFRGANARSLKQAKHLFLRPAYTIRLTKNYRSQARTVAAGNALMENYGAPMRAIRPKGKWPLIRHMPDGLRQAKLVAAAIKRSLCAGVPLREQAVLVRILLEADLLARELERLGVPFVRNGGARISDSEAIKSFIRTVGWLVNPLDFISGLSVVRLVPGIGATKSSMICETAKNVGVEEVDQHVRVPAASRPAWNALVLIGREVRKRNRPRRQVTQKIIAWLEKVGAVAFSKKEKDCLCEGAAQSDDWLGYLDGLAEADDDDNDKQPDDVLTISTIHSAKGREWQVVRILDVVNGMIPSHRITSRAELDEERRLLFVAMSRAKNQLEMFAPKLVYLQRHRFEDHSDLNLSPFIAGAVLSCCKPG